MYFPRNMGDLQIDVNWILEMNETKFLGMISDGKLPNIMCMRRILTLDDESAGRGSYCMKLQVLL